MVCNHMIYRTLNNSSCEFKSEKGGNIVDTLPLFKCVMKNQVLTYHVIMWRVYVVVLSIYKLIGRKEIRIVDFDSFQQTYISITLSSLYDPACIEIKFVPMSNTKLVISNSKL